MRRITVRLGDYVEEQKRRDRRAGRLVAALAIVAGLVIAMSATNTTPLPPNPAAPPHLAASTAALQFAPQLAGSASAAQLLRLRNDGGSPLTIAKIAADNYAFRITNDCATLAPNESCSAAVVFAPAAAGAQRAILGVQTEGGSTSVALEGEGRALPAIDLGATDFGSAPVGNPVERSIRFMNSGTTPIAIAKSSVDAPFAIAADTCSGTVAPGVNCELRVQFRPAAAGSATGELLLAGASGDVVAKGALLGSGETPQQQGKPAQLVTAPERLVFPPEMQVIHVKNAGDEPLSIASISASGPFRVTSDCGQSLAGNASCSVSVVFIASRIAKAAGTVSIETNNGGRAEIPLAAEVRSLPPVDLPPTDFGRALAGTAVERIVRFTNSAPATVVVGKAISSPPFAIAFDGCLGRKVAQGDGCDVRLQFRPTASGSISGELQLVGTGGDVVARGALRGIGLERRPPPQVASIDINPREINFHGDPGKKTIVVTNTGPIPVALSAKPAGASRYLIDTSQCNRQLLPRDSCTISIDGTIAVRIGASSAIVISYPGFTTGVKVLAK
jgi:hypothetical protein